MMDSAIQTQLLNEVALLPPALQQRVVEFARTLVRERRPPSDPPRHFLDLAGCLDPQDADEMLRAVEEDCERIDPNGW